MHAETVLESESHRVPELPKQKAAFESYASSLPEGKLEAIIADLARVREPVLLACSGGGDSVFLGECLRLAGTPFSVAHVNHHLRPSAHHDEQFVRELTRWWGVEGSFLHVFPANGGSGIEAAARAVRYRALLGKCISKDQILMTGHTASDQLETLFMRLGRGTGLRGLPGIRGRLAMSGVVVLRPLLDVWREEIRRALRAGATPWVDDPTNESDFALRNRIRRGVSEEFRREFSQAATGRSLRLLAEESRVYQAMIREKADSVPTKIEPGWIIIDVEALAGLRMTPTSGASRGDREALIRSVLAELLVQAEIPFEERLLIEVADAIQLGSPFTVTSRGVRVERSKGTLQARRVDSPSVTFKSMAMRDMAKAESIGFHDVLGHGPQAIGDYMVEMRQVTAREFAERPNARVCHGNLEYFDRSAVHPSAVFRGLDRSDMWIAPDGRRSGLWSRAKRDGLNEAARRSAVVLANNTDVYWLLGGRRSALAWISDDTRSIIEVRVRLHQPGVETP